MFFLWAAIGCCGAYYVMKNNSKKNQKSQQFSVFPQSDAIDLLKKRYAQGEIDEETYQRTMKELRG